jgi:SAM-dependent methyltransferase
VRIEHVYVEPRDLAERQLGELVQAGVSFKGKRVLDLGCGTGTYTELMAELGAVCVTGVDSVPENIQVAREHRSLPNLQYECRDIEAWVLADRYDLIFMRGTIYYLREAPAHVFEKIAFALVPGGETFISFISATKRSRVMNGVKRVMSRAPEFLRPALRLGLSAVYWAVVRIVEGRWGARWTVINEKMNTVFFPARHLICPDEARASLERAGFEVRGEFHGHGLNPAFSEEFGIWAALRLRGESVS